MKPDTKLKPKNERSWRWMDSFSTEVKLNWIAELLWLFTHTQPWHMTPWMTCMTQIQVPIHILLPHKILHFILIFWTEIEDFDACSACLLMLVGCYDFHYHVLCAGRYVYLMEQISLQLKITVFLNSCYYNMWKDSGSTKIKSVVMF